MASALGLVDPIRETAIMLYRRALDEDMLRGRSIEGMATAALYAATRIEGAARSLDEVANVSRVEKLEIERSYRYLVDELDVPIPPTDPETFIARFASKLELTDETERQARALVHAAIEAEIHSGRNPVGIAAASLYAAGTLTEERLVQSDVAEVSDVSEVTIRNRYREILDAAE